MPFTLELMQVAAGKFRTIARAVLPRHPAQGIAVGFGLAILVGTLVLMLPIAKSGPGGADFLDALFTATSAVCVTGLGVVDTATYWTPLGQTAILILIQLGGFGIMSFASLLGVLMARRLGLKSRIQAAAETKSTGFGDVRSILFGILRITIGIELVVAAVLALRFGIGYGHSPGHALSAFNNAGFALFSDNLMGFVGDPWICLPIAVAIIIGGLGFPVLFELGRHYRKPLHWSMNTKLVLSGTGILLALGTSFISVLEWNNPKTLGVLSTAGTAGGLKITTFGVLFFILLTEIQGGTAVNVFGKRLSRSVHRQAITIVLLAVALVIGSTMALMVMTDIGFDRLFFETVSAFATVGLSTGITASLPPAGQVLLVLLMFVGRLGPVTLASALALRSRTLLYEFPKERPLIG